MHAQAQVQLQSKDRKIEDMQKKIEDKTFGMKNKNKCVLYSAHTQPPHTAFLSAIAGECSEEICRFILAAA